MTTAMSLRFAKSTLFYPGQCHASRPQTGHAYNAIVVVATDVIFAIFALGSWRKNCFVITVINGKLF